MSTLRPRVLFPAIAVLLAGTTNVVAQPADDSPSEKKYLSRAEVAKKYDADGDGRLNQEERAKLRRDIVAGRLNVPPGVLERFRRGETPNRPQPRTPQNVTIHRDVVYGAAGDRALKLDMILPKKKSDAPLPLIVFIHGGGWRGGDKGSGIGRVAPFVAGGNYVGATINYRLSGEATWPAQIHDCKAAIRWLRANAKKYDIDPERIGVWGSSAGGHLVNMLGTSGDVKALEGDCGSADESSRVTCVVPFCGPANFVARKKFEGGRRPSAVDTLLGGRIEEKRELAKQASPVTYVSQDDPPFLIVHGTADGTVPFEQAETLHQTLEKAGVDVTLVKIVGGGHGIGGEQVTRRVQAFFDKHLRGQDVEVSAEPIEAARRR